jgi:predicted DNA repair protein MutK
MRFLSVAGTAAMFLVGGGILVHGVPALHHAVEAGLPAWAGLLANAGTGVLAGAAALLAVSGAQRLRAAIS